MDPTSFGRTVENMFYTSFLVKEGKAKIFFKDTDDDDENIPFIIPLKRRKNDEGSIHTLDDREQVLMSISIEDWTQLKV